jgi:hypothetical protein
MDRNVPMLIAASYFWSDVLNAFLFGHGAMTPALADAVMLTGLDITTAALTLNKRSFRIDCKSIGGWKGYILKYAKTGSIDTREHTAFLNMWLEKHVFCGKSLGPTTNPLALAETLSSRTAVPLGKHLLGSLYQLLHQVSVKLSVGEPIGNLGSPWCFINLWLNLHPKAILKYDFRKLRFPKEQPEDAEPETRRCMSFGEAMSVVLSTQYTPSHTADFFRAFYNGLTKNAIIWFAYLDDENLFELPINFNFNTAKTDEASWKNLIASITPGILPAGFFGGKVHPRSYEFYYKSVAAHQLAFGQVPIKLFFADATKPREILSTGLECS